MEGTIHELIVKRLDGRLAAMRKAKRRLSSRLLKDPKLDMAIHRLASIRHRIKTRNPQAPE